LQAKNYNGLFLIEKASTYCNISVTVVTNPLLMVVKRDRQQNWLKKHYMFSQTPFLNQ